LLQFLKLSWICQELSNIPVQIIFETLFNNLLAKFLGILATTTKNFFGRKKQKITFWPQKIGQMIKAVFVLIQSCQPPKN